VVYAGASGRGQNGSPVPSSPASASPIRSPTAGAYALEEVSPHRPEGSGSWTTKSVAVVQYLAEPSVSVNLEHLCGQIRLTALHGCDLVVMPELAMIDPRSPMSVWDSAAEPLDGPFVTGLREAAAADGIAVICGVLERDGDHRFNTLVAIDSRGDLIARYRKIHLFDALGVRESERVDVASPEVVVAVLDELPVGLMTCYDVRFPELARALVEAGAELLALPAAWYAGDRKLDQWNTLARARAIENTVFVAAADQRGPAFVGFSQIIGPDGSLLAHLEDGDDVATANLVAAELDAYRLRVPSLTHRRIQA
jgi:predicted amidohydrolase